MAQSLIKLSLETNQYERNIRQAQKSWNDFIKSIGLSASKFTAAGVAIGAMTGALKVAKDAFFKNEQQLDEWNRTVEASKSVYNGFLNALNTGDISGFLSNVNIITQAARDAYDALDELGTFNAFNQIQSQKTRTAFTEAMAGYRMGETSKENVQAAARAYQKELRTRMEKEQEAYSQAVRKIAAERGVSWGGLEQALTGKYGDYETLKNTMPTGTRYVYQSNGMFGGTTATAVPVAVTIQEKMGEALRQLNDTELKDLQALGAQAYRTGEEIAQIDKQMARVLNGRQTGSSGSGGSGSGGGRSGGGTTKIKLTEMQTLQEQIQELEQEYIKLGGITTDDANNRKKQIQAEIEKNDKRINQIKLLNEQAHGKLLGGNVQTDGLTGPNFRGFADLPSIGKGLSSETIEKVREAMKPENRAQESMARNLEKFTGYAERTLGGVSDIVGGVSRLGIEIPTGLQDVLSGIQGVTSILTGIVSLVSLIEALTAVQTTESTIKSIPGIGWLLAGGGIVRAAGGTVVPGNYGYDAVPALLTSGELVLNKAQQRSLSDELQGNGMQNMRLRTEVSGRNLIVVIENDLKATGKGQLVTFKG